ncbi:MAG: hypothetical protein MRY63_13540 [Neomegalonema sp.]|nr:hypothetical protein [Neomegalonema sp.]
MQAHRLAYGKRVLFEGGPIEPGRDYHVSSHSAGLSRALIAACRPDALGAILDLIDTAQIGTFLITLRPVRSEGDEFIIAQRLSVRSEKGEGQPGRAYLQANALVFTAADWRQHAPWLTECLPRLIPTGPDIVGTDPQEERALFSVTSPKAKDWPGIETSLEDDQARHAAALLQAIEARAVLDPRHIPGQAGFWLAVAQMLMACPPSLRPLISAADNLRLPHREFLVTRLAQPLEGSAPEGSGGTGAARALAHPVPPRPNALRQLQRQLDGEWRLPWDGPSSAAAAFRDLLHVFSDDRAQSELKRFLTEIDAPQFSIPMAREDRIAFLARLIGAVHARRLFHTDLPAFGLARCVGLIACTTDPSWSESWERIASTQPGRLFWSALLLRTPEWLAPLHRGASPIATLAELSQILENDLQLRSALPEGTPTPVDGPAFKRRLSTFAAQGPTLLTLDPGTLVDPDGEQPALWVRERPNLFADLPDDARHALAAVLQAVRSAAELFARDEALMQAVAQLRAYSLKGILLKGTGGQDGAEAGLIDPACVADFAQRWAACEAARGTGRGGARFWRDALFAWFERAESGNPEIYFAALGTIRQKLDRQIPAHGPILSALKMISERGAHLVMRSFDGPEQALETLLPVWLRGLKGSDALSALDLALLECGLAQRLAEAAQSLPEEVDTARLGMMLAETTAQISALGAAGDGEGLMKAAREALPIWAALCQRSKDAALQAAANRFLTALDSAVSSTDARSARPILETMRDYHGALFTDVALLVAEMDGWPAFASQGLGLFMGAGFGGLLAAFAGGYPLESDLPSVLEQDADIPEVLDAPRLRLAIATRAVQAWRRHFESLVEETNASTAPSGGFGLGQTASLRQRTLAPEPDPQTLSFVLQCIAECARSPEAEARLGADIAWSVQRLLAARQDPQTRAPTPAAPAPLRRLWERMAEQPDHGGDLPVPEAFAPFLLARLLRRALRPGWPYDPIVASLADMLTAVQVEIREGGNLLPRKGQTWLRETLYPIRGSEAEEGWEAMDDDAVRLRLDRALFFLCLIELPVHQHSASSLRNFWAPAPVSEAEARRLQPPRVATERLKLFVQSDPVYKGALSFIIKRAGMDSLTEWAELFSQEAPKVSSMAEIRARRRRPQAADPSEEEDR